MSLHYIYSVSTGSNIDITQYCRLYRFSAQTDAKEGSTPHSTLIVDDPDGALEFLGHRRLHVYEDLAASSNRMVYNGFIAGKKVRRGPYRTERGRVWELDLVDQNTLLNRRVMNGADANRPAETDVARMSALVGYGPATPMTELNTIDDTLYFSAVNPVNMDAADYRTQPVGTGYIDDCAQASGRNYFVWYREAVGQYSLWYDAASSSNWRSPSRLSNVLSDVDDTITFAVDLEHEAVLDVDPSRVASGILLPYAGTATGSNTVMGSVYVQSATTTANFAAIDWVAPSANVKSKTMAQARAQRYLLDAGTEDALVNCSVKLSSQHVNDFLAGQLVSAKFSHFTDYRNFSDFRILSRTVNEISEDSARAFRVDLELSPLLQPGLQDTYAILFGEARAGTLGPAYDYWHGSGNENVNPIYHKRGPIDYKYRFTEAGGDVWSGFVSSGTGTLTAAAYDGGLYTMYNINEVVTMSLRVNGVAVHSEIVPSGPNVGRSYQLNPVSFSVVPGDVIELWFSTDVTLWSAGEGNTDRFLVYGNLA